MILAIDPGNERSAFLRLDAFSGLPVAFDKQPNAFVLANLAAQHKHETLLDHRPLLAIEMIASYGMPVGREVFETCVWIGRFIQAWPGEYVLVYRKDVKLHHCHSPRANDATIRAALIDRFGGKEQAIGKKASPGPLYGIKADAWSALAIALLVHDRGAVKTEAA